MMRFVSTLSKQSDYNNNKLYLVKTGSPSPPTPSLGCMYSPMALPSHLLHLHMQDPPAALLPDCPKLPSASPSFSLPLPLSPSLPHALSGGLPAGPSVKHFPGHPAHLQPSPFCALSVWAGCLKNKIWKNIPQLSSQRCGLSNRPG